ncbi:hypothetical protein Goari_005627 [Gossypium aridum]|uniref:Uncharacterized protein n=1 Tax=Gossypium aridum TaxID=34290 RepID=A0A7J8YL53_GOSAI|nr:hypothetical protein [Gossypium aridum]
MPYADSRIQECVPEEFLANRSVWHVKVCHWSSMTYTRSTYEGDRMKIGPYSTRSIVDWLPTLEPYLTPELVTSSDYMDWFRHHRKPCLLPA